MNSLGEPRYDFQKLVNFRRAVAKIKLLTENAVLSQFTEKTVLFFPMARDI